MEGPEVQIGNDPAALKWIDSPYTDVQSFDIAKIKDQVPTIVSPRKTVCARPSHQ